MHWPEGGRRETGGIVDEAVVNTDVEARVLEIGSELYRLAAAAPPSLFDGRGLKGRAMSRAAPGGACSSSAARRCSRLPCASVWGAWRATSSSRIRGARSAAC